VLFDPSLGVGGVSWLLSQLWEEVEDMEVVLLLRLRGPLELLLSEKVVTLIVFNQR